jgi:hypothetical protein
VDTAIPNQAAYLCNLLLEFIRDINSEKLTHRTTEYQHLHFIYAEYSHVHFPRVMQLTVQYIAYNTIYSNTVSRNHWFREMKLEFRKENSFKYKNGYFNIINVNFT